LSISRARRFLFIFVFRLTENGQQYHDQPHKFFIGVGRSFLFLIEENGKIIKNINFLLEICYKALI
jgi:hypothetical protein